MSEYENKVVPLLPLRGLLVYPTMVLHLDVGRDKSVEALENAMVDDHLIFLTTQKDISLDEPAEADLYRMGTLTKVKQMLKLYLWKVLKGPKSPSFLTKRTISRRL